MADLSASQVRKLGERLRKSESPSPEDRLLLQRVLLAHEAPTTDVAKVLADELGYESTTRLKTEGTLLDKLRREKSNPARVDDIAGIRLHAVANRVGCRTKSLRASSSGFRSRRSRTDARSQATGTALST